MSEEKKAGGSKPDYHVFTSRVGSDFKTKIGAGWVVGKGEHEGISISLDALPVSGKLILFPPSKDNAADG